MAAGHAGQLLCSQVIPACWPGLQEQAAGPALPLTLARALLKACISGKEVEFALGKHTLPAGRGAPAAEEGRVTGKARRGLLPLSATKRGDFWLTFGAPGVCLLQRGVSSIRGGLLWERSATFSGWNGNCCRALERALSELRLSPSCVAAVSRTHRSQGQTRETIKEAT